MKVLIASTPATGHINPMFSIGKMLVAAGHEVVGLSATAMRDRIEAVGAAFRAFPAEADLDLRNILAVFPELANIPPGIEMSRFYCENALVGPMAAQYEGLQQVLRDFPADVIIADNFLCGIMPMLLGQARSERPPIVLCGTMFLHSRRDDGAPNFAGLPPASSEVEREEYAAISKEHDSVLYGPVLDSLNARLAGLGVRPLSMNLFHALVVLPDAYLQLTAPSFEFPRQDLPDSVHFVGSLPIIPNQAPLPTWAHELDGSRKVVLVTQGTVNNFDFGQLVAPALAALANEPDVLVVVTAGGRPVDAIPGPIPANARVASYLPFEWALAKADVFVTNGGYGSVNQSLSFGIPLVTAGLTEDKADVNARVGWSGVGINLATNEPTPEALREAVRAVLDKPNYRSRASAMAKEFGEIDTRSEILRILDEVSGVSAKERGRRVAGR
ncbi:MAG: nucleotide disphospho-sugar-binding domain-containing protein [Methylocella sp.]